MVTLTYDDMKTLCIALGAAVICSLDKGDLQEYEQNIHVWERLLIAIKEVGSIEPKPLFKLTREGE